VVNHLAEMAAAIASACPAVARDLWPAARGLVAERALLEGASLPAKANLLARWSRSPDRAASYVAVANPLGGS